jgi:hypothetical protein
MVYLLKILKNGWIFHGELFFITRWYNKFQHQLEGVQHRIARKTSNKHALGMRQNWATMMDVVLVK